MLLILMLRSNDRFGTGHAGSSSTKLRQVLPSPPSFYSRLFYLASFSFLFLFDLFPLLKYIRTCLFIFYHRFIHSSFFPLPFLDRRIATLMTTRRDAIGAIGAIMILFIDCNLLGCAFLACLIHRCELYLDRNDRAIGRCG